MKLAENDLRKAQLLMLKILKAVHKVCEENDIKYFLSDGSLIGAVRHEGFIPWDDDLDIGMLRKDYEKFLKIAQDKLGEEYFVQSEFTDKYYGLPFAKVMLKNTNWFEEAAKKTKRQYSGIYIDIFPYDKIPLDKNIQIIHYKKFKFWNSLIKHKDKYLNIKNSKGFTHKAIYIFMDILSIFIPLKICIAKRNSLCKKYEYMMADFNITKYGGDFWKNQNSYESFSELIFHRFEDSNFYIPKDYNSILTKLYGDYMQLPSVEERQSHGICEYDFGNY